MFHKVVVVKIPIRDAVIVGGLPPLIAALNISPFWALRD